MDLSTFVHRKHKKRQKKDVLNGWNDTMELLSDRIIEQAICLAWVYEKMSEKNFKINNYISLASCILGGIVGTTGLITVSNSDGARWYDVISMIIGFVITILTGFSSILKFSENQAACLQAQVRYAEIANTLVLEKSKPTNIRKNAGDIIHNMLRQVELLKLSSPIIDEKIKGKYDDKRIIIDESPDWQNDQERVPIIDQMTQILDTV